MFEKWKFSEKLWMKLEKQISLDSCFCKCKSMPLQLQASVIIFLKQKAMYPIFILNGGKVGKFIRNIIWTQQAFAYQQLPLGYCIYVY